MTDRGFSFGPFRPFRPYGPGDKANFEGKDRNDIWVDSAPVRKFDPNPWKLYDMLGNVSEWVLDRYYKKYYPDKAAELLPTRQY